MEWYLTSVGLVTVREFTHLDGAYAWLEHEGFTNFSTEGVNQ